MRRGRIQATGGRAARLAPLLLWAAIGAGGCGQEPAESAPELGPASAVGGAASASDAQGAPIPADPADLATLLIQVRSISDGSPLAEIPLEVWWTHEQQPARTSARSNAAGDQDVQVPHGARLLEIRALPTAYTAPARLAVDTLLRGGTTTTHELRVAPGGTVHGRVLDETGAPLAGARVAAFYQPSVQVDRAEEPSPAAWARAGADGSFHLGGFPAGAFVIEAVAEGRGSLRRAEGWIETGAELRGFELVAGPGRRVLGQVHNSNGVGIEEARVVAAPPAAQFDPVSCPVPKARYLPARPRRARTDADGLFRFSDVPAEETWEILALHPRHLPARGELLPGDGDVFLEMGAAAVVEGRLTGADGNTLLAATLILYRSESELVTGPGGTGAFLFPSLLPEPENWLLVAADGHAPLLLGPLDVQRGSAPLNLQLESGASLHGRVLDRDGTTLAEAEIELTEQLPEPGFPPEWMPLRRLGSSVARTAADGSYRWDHLGSGPFQLTVRTADGRTQVFDDLRPSADAQPIRLQNDGPNR